MNKLNIVQFGSCEGNDHVYEFISKNTHIIDNAIFIDANIRAVDATFTRYSKILDLKKIKTIHTAIVTDPSIDSIEFFIPNKDPIGGHSSIFKSLVAIDWGNDLEKVIVPATTTNKLLDFLLNEYTKIDMLYIDVEGLDADIILDLNLDKYNIPYIQYEAAHTDGHFRQGTKFTQCINKLRKYGYELYKHNNNYDIVAVKK